MSQAKEQIVTASEFSKGLIDIREIDLIGGCSRSPNGRYLLCWEDKDYKGKKRGGQRSSGNGRLVLLEGSRLLWQLEFERPNDGVVANNGVIAINDWLFRTNKDYNKGTHLKGTFYLISANGEVLLAETFRANLDKCGISPDGTKAWCSTATSNFKEHSRIVVNYEINGTIINRSVSNL